MQFKELKAPVIVQMELTWACNNNCEFCYNYWRNQKRGANFAFESSLADKKRVIQELAQLGVSSITFTGGEPFLYPGLLDLAYYAKDLGLLVHINSNGTLINDEVAQRVRDARVDWVTIGIQASQEKVHDQQTRTKGSWARSIAGIKNLIHHKIGTNLGMTLTTRSYHLLEGVGELAAELGVGLSVSRFIPSGPDDFYLELSSKEIREVMKTIKKLKILLEGKVRIVLPIPLCSFYDETPIIPDGVCAAGVTWCAISPSLDVRPCTFRPDIVGNLNSQNFDKIWTSDKMRKWRSFETYPNECINCEVFPLCMGGCRKAAKVHNKPDHSDPLMTGTMRLESFSLQLQDVPQVKLDNIFSKREGVMLRRESFG